MKNDSNKQALKIVMIGSGNVATHLSEAFVAKGHKIVQVYSRTKKNAEALSKNIFSRPISDLKKITPDADIYIFAVNDDAVKELSEKIIFRDKIFLHTSGSLPLSVLKNNFSDCGVLYPLQTFSKNRKINMQKVPICVEGSNKATEKIIFQLAKSISKKVQKINSEKRKILHLAAIFVNNFPNHLFSIAEKLTTSEKINFSLLIPLMEETVSKIKTGQPAEMQTGPAIRKDKKIMDSHLKLLKNNQTAKEIYTIISKSIAQKE
ncbi:MAG: DUF2520 domain-containing protein [Bacteroidia bacterium]